MREVTRFEPASCLLDVRTIGFMKTGFVPGVRRRLGVTQAIHERQAERRRFRRGQSE